MKILNLSFYESNARAWCGISEDIVGMTLLSHLKSSLSKDVAAYMPHVIRKKKWKKNSGYRVRNRCIQPHALEA